MRMKINRNSPQKRSGFIWVVAAVVCLSTLGTMNRFQGPEPDLLLALSSSSVESVDRALTENAEAEVDLPLEAAKEVEPAKELKTPEEVELMIDVALAVENPAEDVQENPVPVVEHQESENKDLAPAVVQKSRSLQDRKVYFMTDQQVNQKDAFSASWLQKTEEFLTMDLESIGICEDAAFRAYRGAKARKLRMTLDWLDFR